MIKNGFRATGNGRMITDNSSEESKWLSLILKAINNLAGVVAGGNSDDFIVGTTTGGPTNGSNTWTITTLNLQNDNPLILLNGTPLVNGVNYSFVNATQVLTLLPSPGTVFTTGQTYTIVL